MTLVQTEALRSLPPYVFAELDRLKSAARARGASLIDLGIGSPDIPMGAGIADALAAAARAPDAFGYPPFRGTPRYFDAITRFMRSRFGVAIDAPTQALALSGAKEGIAQIITALCGPGDVALVPEIFYPVYARAAWMAGVEVRWVKMRAEDGFVLDLDAIPPEDARRAKLLIVNYPNNPTGARVEKKFYDRAVAFARANDLLLISDLAYSELTFGGTSSARCASAYAAACCTVVGVPYPMLVRYAASASMAATLPTAKPTRRPAMLNVLEQEWNSSVTSRSRSLSSALGAGLSPKVSSL